MPVVNVEGVTELPFLHLFIVNKFSQELAIVLETLDKRCLGNKIFAGATIRAQRLIIIKGRVPVH